MPKVKQEKQSPSGRRTFETTSPKMEKYKAQVKEEEDEEEEEERDDEVSESQQTLVGTSGEGLWKIEQEDDVTVKIEDNDKSEGAGNAEVQGRGVGSHGLSDTTPWSFSYPFPSENGTAIERGRIYLFYRPKVQRTYAGSLAEAKCVRMLLVPDKTLPRTTSYYYTSRNAGKTDRKWRLITIGKKRFPVVKSMKEYPHDQSDYRRLNEEEVFWAEVDAVGDDLAEAKEWLDEESYDSPIGYRTNAPARLAARGVYTLVNHDPSPTKTVLGIYLSHPVTAIDTDDTTFFPKTSIQYDLGIVNQAISFEFRIKNPFERAKQPHQIPPKPVAYPFHYFSEFGCSRTFMASLERHRQADGNDDEHAEWGRAGGGRTYSRCRFPEMLDYEDVQFILIPTNVGVDGLAGDVGVGRARVLQAQAEDDLKRMSDEDVLMELGLDLEKYSMKPLQGKWA